MIRVIALRDLSRLGVREFGLDRGKLTYLGSVSPPHRWTGVQTVVVGSRKLVLLGSQDWQGATDVVSRLADAPLSCSMHVFDLNWSVLVGT